VSDTKEPKENTAKVTRTEAEWREHLTPEQYRVTREKGTERPFSGKYWDTTRDGTYVCVGCGQPLFVSGNKYDAGCGWPSFDRPHGEEAVRTEADHALGMERVEVLCSRCDAHLGHVFPDGPPTTGLRYCINSAALDLKKEEEDARD
jgi:peptide-methionine (R)-S-oxide reductase